MRVSGTALLQLPCMEQQCSRPSASSRIVYITCICTPCKHLLLTGVCTVLQAVNFGTTLRDIHWLGFENDSDKVLACTAV